MYVIALNSIGTWLYFIFSCCSNTTSHAICSLVCSHLHEYWRWLFQNTYRWSTIYKCKDWCILLLWIRSVRDYIPFFVVVATRHLTQYVPLLLIISINNHFTTYIDDKRHIAVTNDVSYCSGFDRYVIIKSYYLHR